MSTDTELESVVGNFLDHFELVFSHDWEFTKNILEDPEYYISEDGTFIDPGVEDESNNWGNRGSLLTSYRALVSLLKERGVKWSICDYDNFALPE